MSLTSFFDVMERILVVVVGGVVDIDLVVLIGILQWLC